MRSTLLLLLLLCGTPPLAAQSPAITRSDREAILKLVSDFDQRWNERDAEGFSSTFAEDGDLAFPIQGQRQQGRTAIRDHYHQQFQRYTPDIRHVTEVTDIQMVGPSVVVADGKASIVGNAPSGSGTTTLRTYLGTAVLVDTAAGWRIRTFRAYLLPEATR